MKKLSLILGLVMVFGFMVGNATAADLIFDTNGDQASDTALSLDSDAAEIKSIDVYVDNWNYAGEPIFGVKLFMDYDNTQIAVLSVTAKDAAGGGCFDNAFTAITDLGGGNYQMEEADFNCACGEPSSSLILFTVQIQCIAEGVSDINVTTVGGAVTPGGAGCGSPHGEQATTATLTVTNAPPPCSIDITPQTASLDSAVPPQSVDFDITSAGNCATPDITYSTTCTAGSASIDPVTGILTITSMNLLGDVSCTVTAADANNPGACALGDCVANVTILGAATCEIEIYIGGYPVPPLNTYNKPGRRGLALTCGDTVCFDYCSDCDGDTSGQEDPCPVFSFEVVAGSAPAGTTMTGGCLTLGSDCTNLDAPAEIVVTVEDPCNPGASPDSVTVIVGQVVLDVVDLMTSPDSEGVQVELSMCNPDHKVKGIQTDIADAGNYLTCTGCAADPDRAPEFMCSALDLGDKCRVVMISTNPVGMIEEGCGTVLTIDYEVSAAAPSDGCIAISPTDSKVSDRFGDPLCVCEEEGEVCFKLCGDVYPRECLPDPNCGDGVVDIFDILEEIDFVLGIVVPSDCQASRADVPTGTPPYCSPPDGEIDIFDVLVIIDMALGKPNCCDYYYLGKIW